MPDIHRPSYSSSSLISRTELRYAKLETKILNEFNGRIIRHIFNILYINVQFSMHEKPNFFMWKPYLICYANKFYVVKVMTFTCRLFQLWKGTNQWRYRRVFIQRWNNHAKPAVARDLLFRVRILKQPLQSRFLLLQAMVLRHCPYPNIIWRYICKKINVSERLLDIQIDSDLKCFTCTSSIMSQISKFGSLCWLIHKILLWQNCIKNFKKSKGCGHWRYIDFPKNNLSPWPN